MAVEMFTQSWALAWAAELNQSEEYRQAAATWEGPVALILAEDAPGRGRAVLLDLWHGACRSAGMADPADLGAAAYVFQGSQDAWRQVLIGGTSPVMALMNGRIRLVKGDLATLLPYAGAAKELLTLAGRVATSLSEG